MNLSSQACSNFEHDISLFVDHQLEGEGVTRLTSHLAACQGCSEYVEDLRELSDMHRDMAQLSPETTEAAFRSLVDRHALFASITQRLLKDKVAELARLFYELGKAYVLAGNHAALGRQYQKVAPISRAVEIRTVTDHARRVAREGESLAAADPVASPAKRRSHSLFSQSQRLFSAASSGGVGALANGQRYLQAALRLDPECDEARLYLGFHHMLVGRCERATAEFRRVYRQGKEKLHRLMALQYLGNVYSARYDHRRAIECYEEVVAEDRLSAKPRFYTALANLGMDCAKLGLQERCSQHFAELVERFPEHLEQSRKLLSQAQDFTALLQREARLRETLRRSAPALFAA